MESLRQRAIARLGSRLGLVTVVAFAASARADEITLRTDSGVGVVRVSGEVVDFTGDDLVLSTDGGLRTFDASRVVELSTSRTGPHREGLAAIDAKRFPDAAAALDEALAVEPRTWMRREILAARVRALLAAGDRPAAGDAFLAMLESDPNSPEFRFIPLPWSLDPPASTELAAARRWVEEPSPAARLLGASVLIGSDRDRGRAVAVLDRLAVSLDEQIFHLARVQLWRGRLFDDTPARSELGSWETRIGRIPGGLRGGPYHLLGLASAAIGDLERAVAAHLHAATVYPEDIARAAADGRLAAEHLRRLGREAEAAAIEAELGPAE